MAQLIISAASAAIGFAVGGPVGAQVGWAVGSMVGASLNRPKVQGPRLQDLKVGSSQYGTPIPRVYGSPRVPGQIWWASDKREISSTSGGKGGGPEVTSYSYEVDLLIGLVDGEIAGVTRMWSNGKLVWTRRQGASAESLANSYSSTLWTRLAEYGGSSAQLPDAVYEASVGMDNAPGYRGRSCVFIEGLQLGNSGQLPNLTFEVASNGQLSVGPIETGPATTAHPGNVICWGTPARDSSRMLLYAGTWTNSFLTDLVRVYEIDVFAGTIEQVTTFNLGRTGFGSAAQGSSHEPILVSIVQPATRLLGYSNNGGRIREWTLSEDPRGQPVFWLDEDYMYVASSTFPTSNKIWKHAASGGTALIDSPSMTSYMNSLCKIGAYMYAASKYEELLFVLDADTLDLLDTVGLPSFGGPANDTQPLLLDLNGELGLMGRDGSATGYGIFVRRAGAWVKLSVLLVNYFPTSAQRTAVVVGATFIWGSPTSSSVQYSSFYSTLPLDDQPLELHEVISDLCAKAGIAQDAVDVLDMQGSPTTYVEALALTQIGPTRQTLEQLATGYFFETTLRDKLYFRPRAESPVAEIPFADLAAGADTPAAEPLALTIANDLELPPQVAVTYANLLDDHQQGTEYSDRIISGQAATQTIELAIGLTPAEAKGIADAIVVDNYASRTSTTIALPLEYAHLEAGDVVTVRDENDAAYRLRLVRKREVGTLLQFEGVLDDQTALNSLQITDETQVPSGTVTTPGSTVFEPLDIPILRDADDGPGYYVAARGSTTSWPGAQIQSSINDVDFSTVAEVNESAVFGTASTTLATYTGVGFDELNSVTVDVGNGELSSSTRAAMLADETINAMVIGSEVLRFRDATLSSPGVYVLTGLLRGQRGTEWAIGTHAASERVALLRPQGLRRVATQSSEIDQAVYLRGVTLGTVASDATSEAFTDTGIALKPWAPVALRAARDASNALLLTWKRRTRLATRFTGAAGIYVPLGEAAEQYEVDILNGATVLRTITTASAAATYSVEQQQADFGAVQSSVSVKVYQISATVGRGYPLIDTAAGSDSEFTAAAQANTITFGGTFAAGIYVSVLYQGGGGSGLLGQHYTVTGDVTLGGVAQAVADAINANTGTTGYSATRESPEDAVIVSGPVGVVFNLIVQFTAASAINAITTQKATYASAGTSYSSYVSLVNLLTGVVEPVPSGVTFTLRFDRPIYTTTSTISYTTTSTTTALTVCAGLATALDLNSVLTASGYTVFVNSQSAGPRLVVYGPVGLTDIYLAGSATDSYGLSVSQQTVAQPAYATDQLQTVEVTISGTPAIGEEFWVTLDGVEYAFTAASTSTSDVASGLAADINAGASPSLYSAVAVGAVVTITGVSAAQSFGYDRGVRTLITATIT